MTQPASMQPSAAAAAQLKAKITEASAAPSIMLPPESQIPRPVPDLGLCLDEASVQHYDECSPYYQDLWGDHIHHGIWRTGKESKEEAQVNLIRELISHAELPDRPKVLDVGCGVGGTSVYLAKELGARVIGVTISAKQVEMAMAKVDAAGLAGSITVLHGDGEKLDSLPELVPHLNSFDAVWISEALSHFADRAAFFRHAAAYLKPGGKLVLADWFRAEHISERLEAEIIKPIESGMLLPGLDTPFEYQAGMHAGGLRVVYMEDVSKATARTWDLCLTMITSPSLWALAASRGLEFVAFLKAFKAMREGFASGCFRYALMVAEKPTAAELA